MADIELRFHKDMLTLSAPIDFALARQGVNVEEDAEFVTLFEPESVRDAQRMEVMAGAQCLVTNTNGMCDARLAHKRMEGRAFEIAAAALASAQSCKPQHIVCEIGSCGLPLDPDSAASRKQTQQQYEDAVKAFVAAAGVGSGVSFDAMLFDGLRSVADIECALAGARAVTSAPVFASVDLDSEGLFEGEDPACVFEALSQADVMGFSCAAAPDVLCRAARAAAVLAKKPLLVQISLTQATPAQKKRASLGAPIPENPYALPDALADAALELRAAGVQFVRVVGEATPACTGALAVATAGTDCIR